MTRRSRWKRYLGYYRRSEARLALAVGLSFGQSALIVPIAWLVKCAFDRALPERSPSQLFAIGVGILCLYMVNTLLSLWARHIALNTTKRAIAALRVDLLDRMYALPTAFHRRADTGRLHATIVQDTDRLDAMSNALLAQSIPALAISGALLVWLAVLNIALLAAIMCVLPLMAVVNRVMGAKLRAHAATFHGRFEGFSRGVLQVLQTIDLTRMQSAEPYERHRQAEAIDQLRLISGRMSWLAAAYGVVQGSISATSGVLILVAGGTAVLRGTMSLGDLASYYVGVGLLTTQAGVVVNAVPQILIGDTSLAELCRLLEADEPLPYHGTRRIDFDGEITLEHVSFAYDERPVLTDVTLTVGSHDVIALVGPNGAGKTSLLNLVLGWYRPGAGVVRATGQPYDAIDLWQLRRAIGVVPQEPVLLDATIRENLTYGGDVASADDLEEACRLATALEFITALSHGYETVIGENGARLSGGQRQRLAIARALLRKPRLLVLDEPTNHLDAVAVAALLEHLRALPSRPAVLMITHDTSVAARADRIFVLDGGRILPPRVA